jgi:hypothetical protein
MSALSPVFELLYRRPYFFFYFILLLFSQGRMLFSPPPFQVGIPDISLRSFFPLRLEKPDRMKPQIP